ncbi:MAG: hypothetical protein GXY07_06075 [Candidatus Hydrogenedentes bacterium]|nr:hypothetical protein [Candidatus Hydrogenedentota bacterium]
MIDLLLEHAEEPGCEGKFLNALSDHITAVEKSARTGDRRQVARIEAELQAQPEDSFHFDRDETGILRTGETRFSVGRFEAVSISDLQRRAIAVREKVTGGRVRLFILDGVSPATDIGSLQATAGPETLFQVASQFNCLESPGPYITSVANYFNDPTQGPRASISAFPGTLLRHYAAPGKDGERFVQTNNERQINLLEAVCSPGVAEVRNGYLTSSGISDRLAFINALERRFEEIRVGMHEDVPVVLGYNWDGAVRGERRIGQVFTSTFAGGGYSRSNDTEYREICINLLRAAYLGTLLAAVVLRRSNVVLTLIGGGVFGNPIPLIWEAIQWALHEVEPLMCEEMNVVLNGRNLGDHISLDTLLPAIRARGGAMVQFGPRGISVRH